MNFVLSTSLSMEKLGESPSGVGSFCAKAGRCKEITDVEGDPAVRCGWRAACVKSKQTKGSWT